MTNLLRRSSILLATWLIAGCGDHRQPVDLFAELVNNAPYSTPTCPEIRSEEGKYLDLRNVQVFSGPNYDREEMKKIEAENNQAIVSLWTSHHGDDYFWMVWCQYHGIREIIEINLPNTTRYCVSLQVKEPAPRAPKNLAFWCVPSLIPERTIGHVDIKDEEDHDM